MKNLSDDKPFDWSRLPKFSRQQVQLHEAVTTYLSSKPFEPSFVTDLSALLSRELRGQVQISGLQHTQVLRSNLSGLLPQWGYFAVVSLGPSEHKILLDVDLKLGAYCVERLMGGQDAGEQLGALARAPTEMETGVLSYLVLHLLAFLTTGLQGGRELALTLDRIEPAAANLDTYLMADEHYVCLGTRVQADQVFGNVRVLVPESVITTRWAPGVQDAFELSQMRRRLDALPEQSVLGRVEGARLDLTPDDIANLEVGDIIVLENHALSLSPDTGAQGDVALRLGRGEHGHIDARLVSELGNTHLVVTAIKEQHTLDTQAMSDTEDKDNLPETEGLLREMESQVAVELGRIKLNTAQVVRLKAGQVLHLSRGAADPVQLVIGGKLFAQGELIEVDGEMGVRLTQLTGNH